jgi:hypothetical protein
MHFRVRKNVVQLVRTSYVGGEKKPEAKVVGSLSLASPQITEELQQALSPGELGETQQWIEQQHRLITLKEELAAMQLAENMDMAKRWLKREKQSAAALRIGDEVREALHSLRKILKSQLDEPTAE